VVPAVGRESPALRSARAIYFRQKGAPRRRLASPTQGWTIMRGGKLVSVES